MLTPENQPTLACVALLALGLTACEPPPKPAAAPQLEAHSTMTIESNAPPPKPPAPIVALTVKIGDAKKMTVIEVKADGSITADGTAVGKIVGNVVQDDDGKPVLVVDADGTLEIAPKGIAAPKPNGARFDANDAVIAPNGDKIVVADDGSISHIAADGKSDKLPTSIEGFTLTSKREVLMVVMFATLPASGPNPPPK